MGISASVLAGSNAKPGQDLLPTYRCWHQHEDVETADARVYRA